MRRPTLTVLAGVVFVFVVLLAGVATNYSEPRIERRAQVLRWKISGAIPYVTWYQTMRALLPSDWRYPRVAPADQPKEKSRGQEPCPVLWQTPIGDFWGQRNDDITLADLPHLERYLRGPVTIRSGDVVVDVGSQIGTFTRVALDRGAGLVVAIEPNPGNNACFKQTFAKEIAERRVILLEEALWDSSGTMKFTIASRSDGGAIASEFDPTLGGVQIVDVPTTTLDDAVQRLKLPRVDFIKWAMSGARHPLLGSRQTFSRFRPRMVMVICISPDEAVTLPKIVLEAVPTYHVFTNEVELAYFY